MEQSQQQTEHSKPVMLRADITGEEWLHIRQEALARKTTTSKFVSQLLRAGLECLPSLEESSS